MPEIQLRLLGQLVAWTWPIELGSEGFHRQRWPGNVRQLCSCLRTLVALSEPGEAIQRGMLPAYLQAPPAAAMPSTAEGLEAMEEAAMRAALRASKGNVAQAARALGISRSTLYRRVGATARRH